jgi:DNA-binding response OmpR family regulator
MRHILIIEDNQLLANTYRAAFAQAGFTVDVASDGQAGVAAALAAPPEIILLDLMLPKLSGLEVLRRLRTDTRLALVPVLVLSNAYTAQRMQELWDAGATQVLLKANSTPKRLLESVRQSLDAAS